MPLKNKVGFLDSGLAINGIIESYKVAAGENISAGSFVEYVNEIKQETIGSSTNIYSHSITDIIQLSDDKVFLPIYYYTEGWEYLYGVVCTISGTTITKGTVTQISKTHRSGNAAVTALDSSRIFIVHPTNMTGSRALICTIEGTTITVSTDIEFPLNLGLDYPLELVKLNSSKVFAFYYDDNDQEAYGIVCTISGTNITTGAETLLSSRPDYVYNIVALDESKVFIGGSKYNSSISDDTAIGVVVSISGTTITEGAYTNISTTASSGYIKNYSIKLDSNKVLQLYSCRDLKELRGRICNIAGTSITLGTETTLSTEYNDTQLTGVKLDSDKVLITYGAGSNRSTSYLTCMQCAIEGSNIVVVKNTRLSNTQGEGEGARMGLISNNKTLVVYNKSGNKHGMVYIPESSSSYIKPFSTYISGIANKSGSGGEMIDVWVPNINYVEYIQSSGTQYIDTGFIPNQDTRVVMDFQWLGSGTQAMFGARTSAASNTYGFLYNSGSFRSDYYTSYAQTWPGSSTARWQVDKNGRTTTFNGTSQSYSAATFVSPNSLYLFAVNELGNIQFPSTMRLYSCKVYDNGTLVRDYNPCLDASGVACLYDKVNKEYVYNAGTGAFTAGTSI